ncbi:hypothetical protein C8R45DRAFT_922781 [Mycena sanguinolenta]|nr:hypothetical protein C8R45DRAFT_922781 [Mycena sanguinolenta]
MDTRTLAVGPFIQFLDGIVRSAQARAGIPNMPGEDPGKETLEITFDIVKIGWYDIYHDTEIETRYREFVEAIGPELTHTVSFRPTVHGVSPVTSKFGSGPNRIGIGSTPNSGNTIHTYKTIEFYCLLSLSIGSEPNSGKVQHYVVHVLQGNFSFVVLSFSMGTENIFDNSDVAMVSLKLEKMVADYFLIPQELEFDLLPSPCLSIAKMLEFPIPLQSSVITGCQSAQFFSKELPDLTDSDLQIRLPRLPIPDAKTIHRLLADDEGPVDAAPPALGRGQRKKLAARRYLGPFGKSTNRASPSHSPKVFSSRAAVTRHVFPRQTLLGCHSIPQKFTNAAPFWLVLVLDSSPYLNNLGKLQKISAGCKTCAVKMRLWTPKIVETYNRRAGRADDEQSGINTIQSPSALSGGFSSACLTCGKDPATAGMSRCGKCKLARLGTAQDRHLMNPRKEERTTRSGYRVEELEEMPNIHQQSCAGMVSEPEL